MYLAKMFDYRKSFGKTGQGQLLKFPLKVLFHQPWTKKSIETKSEHKSLPFLQGNRRVARIWKRGGGGFFERVRKVQTILTRIFIALESESHGLSEN